MQNHTHSRYTPQKQQPFVFNSLTSYRVVTEDTQSKRVGTRFKQVKVGGYGYHFRPSIATGESCVIVSERPDG